MRPDHVTVVGLGLAGVGVVAWRTIRWWTDRGRDVSPSRRARTVAISVTALLIPALTLAGAGIGIAQWWVFAVPIAWVAAGVANVMDQRQARSRDIALGASRRPVLWPPYLVGMVSFLVLEGVMVATLFLWVAVTGDIDTRVIAAVGGAATCGTFVLAGAQHLRQVRAGGGLSILEDVEQSSRRLTLAAATSGLGGVAVAAGVLWASTPTFSAADLDMAARMLVTVPGWVLLAVAWILVRPQALVSDGGPSA